MYVILDLETTGLDPKDCLILEVGILVLDENLDEVDFFRQVVHYLAYIDGKPRPEISDYVLAMHTTNRLWEACANSYMDAPRVESLAAAFMERYPNEPMVGSTINFDRSFLAVQMPKLHDSFHYRNIDVSTLRGIFDKCGLQTPQKKEAHRALADCRETAANLRYYYASLGLSDTE